MAVQASTYMKSSEKTLSFLKALRGHSITGLTLTELAKATGEKNLSQAHRHLQTLINSGFVQKDEHDLYYLSIAFMQFAMEHYRELDLAQQRINEIKRLTL